MKVKVLTGIATLKRTYNQGDECEWPNDEDAQNLIDAGYLEPVEDTSKKKRSIGKKTQTASLSQEDEKATIEE